MSAIEISRTDFLGLLYESHHDWLLGWLRQKLGCPHHAADLAQDTFMRMMRKRDLENLREPRAYLTTIAHGLVVNHWRRLDIERAYLEALASRPEPLAPSPEQRVLILETLYAIDAMVGSLPDRVRRAFLMSRLDGLTYVQIGARLGVSERMVKKYMARAMLHCLILAD